MCARLRARSIVTHDGIAGVKIKEGIMPKMKTKRSAAKRFTVTGSGKVRRRKQNLRHILTKKNAKRKRRLGQPSIVDSANMKSVRNMLPYDV